MSSQVKQGLFAFDGEAFHHHFQDHPEWDHVTWFDNIGLPSAGPPRTMLCYGAKSRMISTPTRLPWGTTARLSLQCALHEDR